MSSVYSCIWRNGGFSFLLPVLFILLLFPELLKGEEKKKSDLPSFLQIRVKGKNVRNGVSREIKEVRFDPVGITRYAPTVPPQGKKHISKTERHRRKRFTKVPSSSLAAAWQAKAEKEFIRWKPRFMAGSSLALPDSVLSPDRSLWIFLETHGDPPGPYATRLIFLDTHSWRIVFARDYPEFYAEKALFLGDKLLLYCKGQESRDTKDSFILLDVAEGKILQTVTIPFPAGRMAAKGDLLAVGEKGSSTVRIYSLSGQELLLQKEWKSACMDPALYFAPDGKMLLAAGKNILQKLLLSNFKMWEKVNIDLLFPPAKLFMPGHGLVLFLPGSDSPGTDARLLRNGVITPLGGVSGGEALPGLVRDHFYLLLARQSAFADYLLPSCEAGKSVSGIELRPRTKGRVHFARTIPHANSIAVMDSNGIFYLIFPDYAGKRFQKMILIQ